MKRSLLINPISVDQKNNDNTYYYLYDNISSEIGIPDVEFFDSELTETIVEKLNKFTEKEREIYCKVNGILGFNKTPLRELTDEYNIPRAIIYKLNLEINLHLKSDPRIISMVSKENKYDLREQKLDFTDEVKY